MTAVGNIVKKSRPELSFIQPMEAREAHSLDGADHIALLNPTEDVLD